MGCKCCQRLDLKGKKKKLFTTDVIEHEQTEIDKHKNSSSSNKDNKYIEKYTKLTFPICHSVQSYWTYQN